MKIIPLSLKHFSYFSRLTTVNAQVDSAQSLFMSLAERERRLDSIELLGVTWEGAKEKYSYQPRPQGLLFIQNGGSEKPLAKAAKMAPKIREGFVT